MSDGVMMSDVMTQSVKSMLYGDNTTSMEAGGTKP